MIFDSNKKKLPTIQRDQSEQNLVKKGAYIIKNYEKYNATILASGSEVEIGLEASNRLEKENIKARVVSFPSFELFNKEEQAYQKNILGDKPVFAIEAGIVNGWEKFVSKENFIGMNSFGASAPYKELYKHFKIDAESLISRIKKNLN